MKFTKKRLIQFLLIITIVFILQGRVRDFFWLEKQPVAQSGDSLLVEQSLQEQKEKQANTIIPCGWYGNDGKLPPMLAGICDGGYQSGVAIKDIACLIAKYNSDFQYQIEINIYLAILWQSKSEVLSLTGKQLKDFGTELSGVHGSAKAEYAYGKILFEAITLLAGTGEITELGNVIKNTKLLKTLKALPILKIASIEKVCPTCATIYKAAQTLRNDLLVSNLTVTQKLLEADFVKSGKTWDVFIKDYEAHHIIPVNMLDESIGLQFYYNNGGKLNFNTLENGMMIRKVSKKGFHANHPTYSQLILQKIETQYITINKSNLSPVEKVSLMDKGLKNIIEETRELIIERSVKGNVKINKLF